MGSYHISTMESILDLNTLYVSDTSLFHKHIASDSPEVTPEIPQANLHSTEQHNHIYTPFSQKGKKIKCKGKGKGSLVNSITLTPTSSFHTREVQNSNITVISLSTRGKNILCKGLIS